MSHTIYKEKNQRRSVYLKVSSSPEKGLALVTNLTVDALEYNIQSILNAQTFNSVGFVKPN